MKRIVAAFSLLVSLFSASVVGAQGVRVKLPAWAEPVLLDSLRQEHALNAAPEMVYRAVLEAYRDLGIPTGNTDGKSGIIGSERFEKMRVLAGAPMSMSFSCGDGANGPNADSYRLTIAVVTWVKPRDPSGTTLGIAVAAAGQDISGVYKNPRECASTGRIELRLKERVEKLVAQGQGAPAPKHTEEAQNTQRPRYPDILRSAGVEGDVMVQFVVMADGSVMDGSMKVLKSTHQLFTDAIKTAMPNMTFTPAEVEGRKVRQLVQQAFEFRVAGRPELSGQGSAEVAGAAANPIHQVRTVRIVVPDLRKP